MNTSKPFGSSDTSSPSAETILQQIRESLSDLSPPGEAHYVQLYQALAEEHQRALDMKQQAMADLLRSVMTSAHLILTLGHPDDHPPGPPASGSPQTIRALIHRRDDQEQAK